MEAFRARADACLISGGLGDAVFHASEAFQGSIREGLTHATLRATLTLAEAHLAAGAPAAALQHALALEHSAAALRLDGLRAAAIVVLAECWLAMSASAAGGWIDRVDDCRAEAEAGRVRVHGERRARRARARVVIARRTRAEGSRSDGVGESRARVSAAKRVGRFRFFQNVFQNVLSG